MVATSEGEAFLMHSPAENLWGVFSFPHGLWECKVQQELLAAPPEMGTGVPPSLKAPWLTCRLKCEQVFQGLAVIHGLKPYIAFIDLVLAGSWSTYTTVCVWLQPGLAVSPARGTPGSLYTLWDGWSSSFHVVTTIFSICVEQHLFGLVLNFNSLTLCQLTEWHDAVHREELKCDLDLRKSTSKVICKDYLSFLS